MTINGANDSATISGSTTGAVAEDGNGRATGTLNVADVDHGQAHVTAQTVQTDQGTFSIGENGQWTFQVNSGNADVQALGGRRVHDQDLRRGLGRWHRHPERDGDHQRRQ
ncbi:VCBS domain-containing protein [Paramagnetospirillum magneticum]|uniref:VCBS domain-containing protein n=1 Tax=Paramagnetospirillum magneticum TaxID=84159 RepID=UPI00130536C3|nr:VCBS domain-containing protein [Paramagnetospirillum magneticum]